MGSLRSVLKNLYRKYWAARVAYVKTKIFLKQYLELTDDELRLYESEFLKIFRSDSFAIGGPQAILKDDGLALFLLVRKLKPQLMLETGTYQGYSGHVNIQALKANGGGSFITCDIVDYRLFKEDFDDVRFQFKLGSSVQNFVDIDFKKVDVFFHDSNHSYDNVMFEIGTAVNNAVKLILCHDFGVNNIHNTIKAKSGKGCRVGFIEAIGDKYDWHEIPTLNGIGLAVLKSTN